MRIAQELDSTNAVPVNVVAAAGAAAGVQADKSAFVEGTGIVSPVAGVLNDTISADPTEDQAAALRITAKRGLHTNLRNSAGTEIATASNPLRTDPTGTTAQPITDNAGSLTVDAPVGTPVFTRLSDGSAALTTTGSRLAVDGSGVTQPVSGTVTANAGTGPFPVSDNSGSLTVDAPAGTPVAVRLSDGSSFTNTFTIVPSVGTLTDRSGTITAGGTAQQMMAANSTRKYLLIQNVSAGDLWINFTTTAVQGQPSIKLTSGSTFLQENSFVSSEAISVIGPNTGQAWSAKEAG